MEVSLAHTPHRYVIASMQPVILENASVDLTFRHDPFVAQAQLKSVLCAPIFNQDKFLGVVYVALEG